MIRKCFRHSVLQIESLSPILRGVAGRGRRRPGALEEDVLGVLSAASEPLTPQQVLDELPGPLAYTTVMTTLTRLTAKGALTRTPTSGRAFAYALAGTADEVPAALTARRMTRLLEGGPDRAGTLARFVAELSADDERLLSELLIQIREAEES